MKTKYLALLFFLVIYAIDSCSCDINKINFKSSKGISIESIDSSRVLISKVKKGSKKGKCKIIDLKNGDYIVGNYTNNKKNGVWYYYQNDTLYQKDVYLDGNLMYVYKIIHGKQRLIKIISPSF